MTMQINTDETYVLKFWAGALYYRVKVTVFTASSGWVALSAVLESRWTSEKRYAYKTGRHTKLPAHNAPSSIIVRKGIEIGDRALESMAHQLVHVWDSSGFDKSAFIRFENMRRVAAKD